MAETLRTRSSRKKKKTKGKLIATILINLFFVLSLIFLVMAAITLFKFKDNPKEAFLLGYRPVIVKSGSMEKTMLVDSIVVIKKAKFEDVKKNDIITFAFDQNFITHRVIDVTSKGLVTKGDNNNVTDQRLVTESDFIGKEVVIFNWTAPVVNDFKSNPLTAAIRWILVPIALICLVIFVLVVLIRILRKIKAPQEKIKKSQEKIEAPQEKIEAPQEKIEAPQEKIEVPQVKTEVPQEKIEVPQEKIEVPQVKTEAPAKKIEIVDDKIVIKHLRATVSRRLKRPEK